MLTDRSAETSQVVLNYVIHNDEPEHISYTWQSLWNIWAQDLQIEVPPLERSKISLSDMYNHRRFPIYVPPQMYQKPESFYDVFSDLLSRHILVDARSISHSNSVSGWMDVMEALPALPRLARADLRLQREYFDIHPEIQKMPENLVTYIIGNAFNHLIKHFYFDTDHYWSHLPGSTITVYKAQQQLIVQSKKAGNVQFYYSTESHPDNGPSSSEEDPQNCRIYTRFAGVTSQTCAG
jgi:hypothetical protein